MKDNSHKNDFKKKLKSYGLLATGVLAVGNIANAQIIYTDVNPDNIISGDSASYMLDLNNDGVKDYRIITIVNTSSSSGSSYQVKAAGVYPLNQNEILTDSSTYIKALNKNEQIGANQLTWNGSSSTSSYPLLLNGRIIGSSSGSTTSYQAGLWNGVKDKYMAVKFDISGSMHYGWVRMDVSSGGDTVVVKGFAYNAQANMPLTAGENGVGFGNSPILIDNINVSASNSTVTINAVGIKENANVYIFDVQGKQVHTSQIGEGKSEITLDVATGIYFVNIKLGDAILTEKVILK